MPYVEMYVDDSDFIGDISDEELLIEVKIRGLKVLDGAEPNMRDVLWRYKNGYIEDAVHLLVRMYPELYGLDKYINGVKNVT